VIFLKLGGSLITDKTQADTPRLQVLARLAAEIAEARAGHPQLRLLLGHGSGSFGHPEAARHGTRHGARNRADWTGYQRVWWAAHRLHRLVLEALLEAGLPALSFPPSASALCEDGELIELAAEPITRALQADLLPVVQGDVAFDRRRGSTIVSTEQVLGFLAPTLHPERILLAGREQGVYAQFPLRGQPLSEVGSADLEKLPLEGSGAADVTGGMQDKVRWALAMSVADPGLQVRVFSGETPGNLRRALLGEPLGTLIAA
jgi:isopentenyl phosphate kinase